MSRLFSCSEPNSGPPIKPIRYSNVKVAFVKVRQITETGYDIEIKEKFGELTKTEKLHWNSFYYFDEAGKLFKKVPGIYDSTTFHYNERQKLIREDNWRDGTISSTNRYEYSNSDLRRKEIQKFRDGVEWIVVSKFDKEGNMIELTTYDTVGNPTKIYTYEHDSRGNMVKIIGKDLEKASSWSRSNEYDSRNNLIDDGTTKHTYEEFDKNGNWLKETLNGIWDSGKTDFTIIRRKIEYYE